MNRKVYSFSLLSALVNFLAADTVAEGAAVVNFLAADTVAEGAALVNF